MSGDRQALLGLALHAAEETGIEAGRLQLLLIELREQIRTRALEDSALELPSDHPFWSQFSPAAVGEIVRSLASMGYRFDGAGGWADHHAPQTRDLALALSYCGYDPRGCGGLPARRRSMPCGRERPCARRTTSCRTLRIFRSPRWSSCWDPKRVAYRRYGTSGDAGTLLMKAGNPTYMWRAWYEYVLLGIMPPDEMHL